MEYGCMMDEKLGGQFVNNERFHVPRLLSIINFFFAIMKKNSKPPRLRNLTKNLIF
jgi:hypothetical protein